MIITFNAKNQLHSKPFGAPLLNKGQTRKADDFYLTQEFLSQTVQRPCD